MQGQRVGGLLHLRRLADARRAVVCPKWMGSRHTPATFVMGMTGYTIQKMLDSGMYLYERKPKEHPHERPETSRTAA